ncbi:LOW QUALITY PROTEIN: leucine-rich repeat-containing protein 17 [Osmerus eperlanus]|uniref:LOW QUALITY PROTEIN: leucine-rich repeat-containing protein 17 n=1 Tax=Osmerus eperlanus TaxID=29151 RepID=UPI002E0F67CB
MPGQRAGHPGPTGARPVLLEAQELDPPYSQVLRANTFSQFRQLLSLDLQQNEINMIEEQAFSGLEQLTTLLLQHNHLRSTSEEMLLPMPRLRHLRLYDNPWECHCHLDSLVRTLQVPSNRNLGNFARCSVPASLQGKKLRQVKAELLCPDHYQSEALEGQDSLPKPLPPSKKDHELTTLCHTYMYPKPLLDCRSKDLKTIPADLPSDIVMMDFSSNTINHLKPKEFLASKDLKLLNLSSNNLDRIDTAAFSGLLYLRELDLSNNSLRYFPYGVLEDLYFLRKLFLGDNPWMCDYNIHYLIYWLKHHPGVAYFGLTCSQPQEFRGWQVEDYVKTYNGECPKDWQLGLGDSEQETSQELKVEIDEGTGRLPSPIRDNRPNTMAFEIMRLS